MERENAAKCVSAEDWIVYLAVREGFSLSLAALHVGGDGSSGRQALEALVGVVDEDPVLVLVV